MSNCASCKWWLTREFEQEDYLGQCRRFPPTPVGRLIEGDVYERQRFPTTTFDAWCGEHTFKGEIYVAPPSTLPETPPSA